MSKTFFILLILFYYCRMEQVDNICSIQHPKKVFLSLGESGVLAGFNVTPAGSSNASFHSICKVDIVTCPSCIISLNFKLMNLSRHCGSGVNLFLRNSCRCDYVWVTEPPYNDDSGVSFCGIFPSFQKHLHKKDLEYRSKTRIVSIFLFYTRAHSHAFTVYYKAEPNRQFFFGTSQHPLEVNFNTRFISSPFFPAAYPRDLTAEYVVTCVKNSNFSLEIDVRMDDDNCRVRLTFTDFQLASSSVMEFYDGSHRVAVVSGTSFRPPIIISKKNSLTIRFYALGHSNIGFKAAFSFVSEDFIKKIAKPKTECGGYVNDFGGTITMVKMVESQAEMFDCIWLIKPEANFLVLQSHLYLKVSIFLGFAGDIELQIRKGLTSESPLLEELQSPTPQNFQEHTIPLQSGYYVSLRAFFGPASHFAVSYASFSLNTCFIWPGFLCRNFRCISKKLTCDGFDHCGDNSDELAICHQAKKFNSNFGRKHNETPNYLFSKEKEFAVVEFTSIVFLISLVGSVFLMSGLTVVLYRIGSKARRERILQDELQSVNNNPRDCLSDEISLEDVVVIDDPPSYEHPPNYEEVVKMSLNILEISTVQQR